MEQKKLISTRYFNAWHTPEMFAVGFTIDTSNLFLIIEIGTLQFILGDTEKLYDE